MLSICRLALFYKRSVRSTKRPSTFISSESFSYSTSNMSLIWSGTSLMAYATQSKTENLCLISCTYNNSFISSN